MSVWRRQRERQLKQYDRQRWREREAERTRQNGNMRHFTRTLTISHVSWCHRTEYIMCIIIIRSDRPTHERVSGEFYLAASGSSATLIYHYSSHRIYWTDINLVSFYEYVHNIPTKCLLKLRGLSQINCGEQIESTESVPELEQFQDCIIHL